MKHYVVSITFEMEASHEEGAYVTTKDWLNDSYIPSDAEIEVEEAE